jgi:steroid delta-isomerase-like uncharacterized protein
MAEPRETVAAVTEAFNAHDEAAMRALYSPDVLLEAPGDVSLEGRDATIGYAMAWLRAFPDARLTIHDTVAEGEWVVTRFTFDGTHREPLAGPEGEIPATGRRLSGRGCEAFRVRGGKIVEEHLYFDQVQVLTQLGLLPEPARTA